MSHDEHAGHDGHAGHEQHAGHGGHAGHEQHAGHGGHGGHAHHGGHGDHAEVFRRRFWLSLVLAIPVVLYSEMFMDIAGWEPPSFPGSGAVPLVLGSIVFWWGGWPFLEGGVDELRRRQPGMMLLVGMAISVAYGASLATEAGWLEVDLWFEVATLIVIMLLGHWQEMKALGQAQGALDALAELLPDDAERVSGDEVETVALHELRLGDLVLVRPGGRVPADGVVVEGEAELDESMVTGESRPVPKGAGDQVVAGTVSTDSTLRVRVDALGEDTALGGIQRLVAEAQASSSRAQALADRAAALLFYVALAAGLVTFTVWYAISGGDDALVRTIAVLVVACPHALGLAIPLTISISTSVAAKAGILVKDRLALERMRSVDVVLFDKTGTLTKGAHVVTEVAVADDPAVTDEATLLGLAGAVEADSEHPLARAIVTAAREAGPLPRASGFRAMTGRGVEAEVEGATVAVGGPALLRELGLVPPAALDEKTAAWSAQGASVLHVVRDGRVVGAIGLEDEVRPESASAVRQLHELGARVLLVTGDAKPVADAVAARLGVDEVFAEVLPEDKDSAVTTLQGRGHRVAMVGDGVNDAPALARADVGIAIGAGTDVAIESAGVILATSDPRAVVGVVRLSRASYRKMIENLVWGAGYNVVAIPLAAGVLSRWGIVLAPWAAAVLMSISTIIVALNAQLLRRVDVRPGEPDEPRLEEAQAGRG